MTDPSSDVPDADLPPDTGGLKLWALLVHAAAIVAGVAVGVASFGWLTR